MLGGAQERARRGGLENVPAIVGFGAAAAELAEPGRLATEAERAMGLTARLTTAATAVEGVVRFGSTLVVNPGSATLPRNLTNIPGTVAILEVADGVVRSAEIVQLGE